MEYQGIRKYKPRRYHLLNFGLFNRTVTITLHPNSRWYAYMDKGVWIVECAKTRIRLSDEEFNKIFERV